MRRDGAKLGTPEREAADREHEAALVIFRTLAEKITVLMSVQRSMLSGCGVVRSWPRQPTEWPKQDDQNEDDR
jgi:hypothetical protein